MERTLRFSVFSLSPSVRVPLPNSSNKHRDLNVACLKNILSVLTQLKDHKTISLRVTTTIYLSIVPTWCKSTIKVDCSVVMDWFPIAQNILQNILENVKDIASQVLIGTILCLVQTHEYHVHTQGLQSTTVVHNLF